MGGSIPQSGIGRIGSGRQENKKPRLVFSGRSAHNGFEQPVAHAVICVPLRQSASKKSDFTSVIPAARVPPCGTGERYSFFRVFLISCFRDRVVFDIYVLIPIFLVYYVARLSRMQQVGYNKTPQTLFPMNLMWFCRDHGKPALKPVREWRTEH